MIDYQQYCQIQDFHDHHHLTAAQIARELHLDERTVAKWLAQAKFRQRPLIPRPSKLDAFKPQIVRWLANHPYTATQIFLRLGEGGYTGGLTIVKDYVRHVRPPQTPAFLTLAFAPGECAQVDWGQFGSINVGNNPAARQWLDTVANVRLHGSTKRKPAELFQVEQPALKPLSPRPYDVGILLPVRANSQFRVTLDTNTYSVPAACAGAQLTLKVYPDHLCIYQQEKLVARHDRSYDRHQDFENPDHPRALLQQRRRASDQKLLLRLLALTPKAEAFYRGLHERRLNALGHVRKIVALSEIYGVEHTARAIQDALEFQAFSCEYIANLLEQRQRLLPEPGALHLTRRQDLLDLELPEPNLNLYGTEAESPPLLLPPPETLHEPKSQPKPPEDAR